MLVNLERRINKLMDWMGAIAASMLIVLVVVIGFNVANRYFFKFSSVGIGLEELSWHLYAASFLIGIPFALRSGSHVRVDLIYDNLSLKTQAIIDVVGSVVFLIPFCLIVIWGGWLFTAEAWGLGSRPDEIGALLKQLVSTGIGEKSQDPGGLLNRWIIKGVIPFSFLMLLVASFAFLINKINVLMGVDVNVANQAHGQAMLDAGKEQ